MEWTALMVLLIVPANCQSYNCPKECICLSSTQVLCNGGGLSQIPDDLPPTVEHLSLTKNNIRHLRTDAFQRYKSLRKLYLDGSSITHIQPFAFRGLGRLQELSMQHTPLDRIGQFTFSGLHNLTHLYLAKNQIKRIESYAFAGTSSIRLLVLTNNPTVRIDSSAFAGLSDVQMIYLPAGVRHLEQDAFNGLSMVGHLKLAYLDLKNQSFNSFVFRGLRNVQLLSIQDCDLGTIRPNIFTNMSNIGRVSFINNKIESIDSLELTADNRVRQFHFIGNHILNPPHGNKIKIQGVGSVNATGNHFPCDCRMASWMNSDLFANQRPERVASTSFCILPKELNGRTVQTAMDEFQILVDCPDETEEMTAVIEPELERIEPTTLFSSRSCRLDCSSNQLSLLLLILLFIIVQCK